MKVICQVLRSARAGGLVWKHQLCKRAFSSTPNIGGTDDNKNSDSSESMDDFERRIFGGDGLNASPFLKKVDRIEKERSALGSRYNLSNKSELFDGLDESFTTLSDGMDRKLKNTAAYFEFDMDEIEKDGYAFRPDMTFRNGTTYEPKDLDLTKPGVRKTWRRQEFETTTEEVLRKADFRNVRFLANFLTEAGIIIKRSKTGISAKAQRKVAREIKTARAFGLMPFTTMGTKQFEFGKTMEELDADYAYETYDDTHNFVDGRQDPLHA